MGAVTPGAAGITKNLVKKIPRVAQAGNIAKKAAISLSKGFTAGTIDIFGQTTIGGADLSLGMATGAYVDGIASESIVEVLRTPIGRAFKPGRFGKAITKTIEGKFNFEFEIFAGILSWNSEAEWPSDSSWPSSE